MIVIDVDDSMEIVGDKSMVNRISLFCHGFNYLEELFKREGDFKDRRNCLGIVCGMSSLHTTDQHEK